MNELCSGDGKIRKNGAHAEQHERPITLDTPDGFCLYGVLNYQVSRRKLVVFVHGLTGEKENHLYYNGARFFPANGFDTFRYDLFSNESNGRKLVNCALSTFSQDLDLVLTHFSKEYDEIHVVGHSIGGCIAMNADQTNVASLILWDVGLQNEAHSNSPAKNGPFEYNDTLNAYLAKLKISYLLSTELIRERAQQGARVVKKIKRPTKLIFAGNTDMHKTWAANFCHIKPPYQVSTIDGAGHGFNELGKNDVLFDETLNWLNGFVNCVSNEGVLVREMERR